MLSHSSKLKLKILKIKTIFTIFIGICTSIYIQPSSSNTTDRKTRNILQKWQKKNRRKISTQMTSEKRTCFFIKSLKLIRNKKKLSCSKQISRNEFFFTYLCQRKSDFWNGFHSRTYITPINLAPFWNSYILIKKIMEKFGDTLTARSSFSAYSNTQYHQIQDRTSYPNYNLILNQHDN